MPVLAQLDLWLRLDRFSSKIPRPINPAPSSRFEHAGCAQTERNAVLGSSFSRESLTVIECACADGYTMLPPCIIVAGKHLLEDWLTDISADY